MEREKREGESTSCLPNWSRIFIFETVKWVVIVGSIYLSVWRYCEYKGYTVFVSGYEDNPWGQFWGIFSAIMVGVSLIYVLWRVISVKQRHKYQCTRDERWRPAIVSYIILCATPCFTLVFVAFHTMNKSGLDPVTTTVLQIVIIGLVVTEWTVKLEQERFTFELLTSMAMDFFFAYDVIAFVMMASYDPDVFLSGWVYPCYIFGVLSMFKYVPTHPTNYSKKKSGYGGIICIVTSLVFNDIPFVIIRLSTMIVYGFLISDLIFLLKNFFVIIFNGIQLTLIYWHSRELALRREETRRKELWEKRAFRDLILWHAERLKQNRIDSENGVTEGETHEGRNNESIEITEVD